MDNIEQLNERIAQLTELVKTGNEAIKNMEAALKAAEEERDRLTNQRRENEPKFERVEKNENYYCLGFHSALGIAEIYSKIETGHYIDKNRFDNNNYFHTEKRAQEVADKISFLLKLERLHDMFCPDYVPDWNDFNELKFSIYYDAYEQKYIECRYSALVYETNVYFPSLKIAQQVCDILNRD